MINFYMKRFIRTKKKANYKKTIKLIGTFVYYENFADKIINSNFFLLLKSQFIKFSLV